ncbi:ParA family protein [Amaricoccus solimangrovi]|uniref:ParA family protein n=1 Tax=Amaricoccus solimangrovi TaxID=2589815 RepID=A0A501WRU9_9RHOB|nr:ParA family protein [Amaricoccus solimangrovi]TPE48496.1 ParA family protein [Amaricoccus solimangrovi]
MGKVVTFAQQKGGSGKTTALAHLATAWSMAGRSVALVDLDPQASLSRWAEIRADPELTLVETKDYRASSDIRAARKAHDYVLIDCPGAASTLLDSVIRDSDLIVAPCQPSAMDVWALGSVLDASRKARTELRILLNRVPPRHGSIEEVLGLLGDARALLLATQFGNRIAYGQAFLSGATANETQPRSTAAAEVAGLRAELTALLNRL